MVLYLLKAVPSGRHKVGITEQFDQRLSAIRRQNSEEILVVRTYHGDRESITELERDLHEELNSVRWQYEWFYGGPEIDLVLDRLDRQFHPERFQAEILEMTNA
jgi:Meiotically up-regulated gene 113